MILCRVVLAPPQYNPLRTLKRNRFVGFGLSVVVLLCSLSASFSASARSLLMPFEVLASQAFNAVAKTFTVFTRNGTVDGG